MGKLSINDRMHETGEGAEKYREGGGLNMRHTV